MIHRRARRGRREILPFYALNETCCVQREQVCRAVPDGGHRPPYRIWDLLVSYIDGHGLAPSQTDSVFLGVLCELCGEIGQDRVRILE
jgi:hypothetical protein